MGWMRAVLAGAVAVALAACGREGEPKAEEPPGLSVVGRWRGAHDEVELFAGGRLLLHQGAYRVAGSYEFVEPGRMLLIYQNALAAVPPGDYRVAVTADSLALCETDAPARCVRYARVTARDSAARRTVANSAAARVAQDSASVDSAAPGPSVARGDETETRLAAPLRPEQLPYEARSAEATPVLKQAYTLQETYRQMHDRYAVSMDELRDVGWQPLPLRHFHQPEMAGDAGRLCIVMRPRAADLWPVHIDSTRTISRGERCD